jgi:hypothetical protein
MRGVDHLGQLRQMAGPAEAGVLRHIAMQTVAAAPYCRDQQHRGSGCGQHPQCAPNPALSNALSVRFESVTRKLHIGLSGACRGPAGAELVVAEEGSLTGSSHAGKGGERIVPWASDDGFKRSRATMSSSFVELGALACLVGVPKDTRT